MYRFIDEQVSSFIEASLIRMSGTGDINYRYFLPISSLGRSRVNENFISNCIDYIKSRYNIDAQYENYSRGFDLYLDLNNCVLTPYQARFYNTAFGNYHN